MDFRQDSNDIFEWGESVFTELNAGHTEEWSHPTHRHHPRNNYIHNISQLIQFSVCISCNVVSTWSVCFGRVSRNHRECRQVRCTHGSCWPPHLRQRYLSSPLPPSLPRQWRHEIWQKINKKWDVTDISLCFLFAEHGWHPGRLAYRSNAARKGCEDDVTVTYSLARSLDGRHQVFAHSSRTVSRGYGGIHCGTWTS